MKVWRTTPWKERNRGTFEGKQCTIQALKDSLITNLYLWSQGFLLGDDQRGPCLCYIYKLVVL